MRVATFIILMAFIPPVRADEKINWSATDVNGTKITVPTDRASVLAFIRPEQKQSDRVLEQIKSVVTDKHVAIVIISGDLADDQAKTLVAGKKYTWPVVADPEFKASGFFGVHVWPTTVVIASSGLPVAHLAGLGDSFATDLQAHLDLAAGAIDPATLQKRLAEHDVVTESPSQMASTYLQVAKKLIESGELDQARLQIDQGMKIKPDDVSLKLALARILTLQGANVEALKLLDSLPAGAVPPAQVAALRGRALVGLEKWDDAKSVLESSVYLNPDPAESHYLLGLIYQHNNDLPHACDCFRKAYESRDKKHS